MNAPILFCHRTIVVLAWVWTVALGTTEVPLFEGLGPHGRDVTTNSESAQRYFDQGLAFLYAFNHDEAIRSFQEAARLDPECAMAHWAISLASGPPRNNPMVPAAPWSSKL